MMGIGAPADANNPIDCWEIMPGSVFCCRGQVRRGNQACWTADGQSAQLPGTVKFNELTGHRTPHKTHAFQSGYGTIE
jgi:hypothetical protein